MQEVYRTKEKQKIIKQMFLVAKIISNMKYDFTGEKTSVLNLLRIKINDLNIRKIFKIYWYQLKYFLIIKFL